jgi:N-formylglutamate deformylase
VTPWLQLRTGRAPLLLSLPHTGTELPEAVARDAVSRELALHDTDWFVDRLYDAAEALDATVLRTAISRSAIDVNRDPSGASLYPGQATTGLVPETNFDGVALWREGAAIDVAARRAWFDPYHAALADELARLRRQHPRVVLYDAHSIRSRVPRLFEGMLPGFNIGTNGGRSCAPGLTRAVAARCGADQVIDGRFRGGWITRHYGAPEQGIHAIQMELAQRLYLDETRTPPVWEPERAAPLQATLREVLRACLDFAREGGP